MNEDIRADPDVLLEAIQRQEHQGKLGKLKIFLGMAAGVGKTYAMLEAARKQLSSGVDVVIGYVETHGRKETDALTVGIPAIPRITVEHRGITLSEMDVDAVLARKPKIALVDELAHTNAPGSRHPKRYQDILELLDAGIDVYTTLNVQHVESRAHTVEEITGSVVQETVPDRVLDIAEVELIDLPPEDLMQRLDEGKVYLPDRAAVAMVNFFREGNLRALREMALRLAAERVGQDVRDYLQVMQIQEPWKTGHRLLVAVSASPLSAQMVRWTRRLSDSLGAKWLAVYVESARALSEADQARLSQNLALARELGAEVITTADEDLVRGVLRIARQHNVTQIVVGKPIGGGFIQYFKGNRFLRRLVAESGNIDVHVVRSGKPESTQSQTAFQFPRQLAWKQYLVSAGVIFAVTALNAFLEYLVGERAIYRSIGLDYLMTIVLLALFLDRGPVLASATLSAILWDYFFLPPKYTFYITTVEDGLMFSTYFVVALVLGTLIARFRAQEKAERRREERTTALYLLTRELADAISVEQVAKIVSDHIGKLFSATTALLLKGPEGRLTRHPTVGSTLALTDKEYSVASWVLQHNRPAGQFTDNLPLSEALYLPLGTATESLGVIGVKLSQTIAPTLEQHNLLDAFAQQAALVIDRLRLHAAAQKSQLAAESERLSKSLLDSISHEMRTPIAAISSAATALAEECTKAPNQRTDAMLGEIKEAVSRLNRLVGNILDITRVESGQMQPKLDWCDVADLVHVTVKRLQRELSGHPVSITLSEKLPLVQMDFVLMEQALTNLLLNAAFHTPAGTPIEVFAKADNDELVLTVTDKGPGIAPDALPHVFEKFYRAPGAAAGGTGLGLSIVKGFVEAQHGRVRATNQPQGVAFTIFLPLEEEPVILQETI